MHLITVSLDLVSGSSRSFPFLPSTTSRSSCLRILFSNMRQRQVCLLFFDRRECTGRRALALESVEQCSIYACSSTLDFNGWHRYELEHHIGNYGNDLWLSWLVHLHLHELFSASTSRYARPAPNPRTNIWHDGKTQLPELPFSKNGLEIVLIIK